MRPLFLALAALPLIASPALAQKKPGAKTSAAVSPAVQAEFKKSDTNKDGFLSRTEVESRVDHMGAQGKQFGPGMAKELAATWFTRADANKDGKISMSEMQKLLRATAAKYDTNGDGVVSMEERAAARAAAIAETRGNKPVSGPTR
ncbi:EF-hand domain-containing protein [Sphingomonas aracearum]|uniref:EF-hand domain-containing protein n=1 Tax=Sphingomonas aracearum TaxID=2283317 RepID=A0A369W5D9_9SPHN|nr:EF-hand domain-containing protein [Sphingomonas aracearum]RDE07291.1 EF-hand domain-containing protein [Sphingomonas aracearum]